MSLATGSGRRLRKQKQRTESNDGTKASIDELIPNGNGGHGEKRPIPPRDVRLHDTDIFARVTTQRLGDATKSEPAGKYPPPDRYTMNLMAFDLRIATEIAAHAAEGGVLVQREMESWRAPLASIAPFSAGQFAPPNGAAAGRGSG